MRSIAVVSVLAVPLLLTAACNRSPQAFAPGGSDSATPAPTGAAQPVAATDPMAANDAATVGPADSEARPLMQVQIVLDRLGFTPGVIDGREGLSTRNALEGFQEANGLPITGKLDDATRLKLGQWARLPATRVVTIPDDFARGPFMAVPKEPADQAKMPALGYASLDEKLAERFHTTVATLQMLNPGGQPAQRGAPVAAQPGTRAAPSAPATPAPGSAPLFRAGQQIRVPNIGNDGIEAAALKGDADWGATLASLGIGTDQPQVERIVVSKSKGTLKAYDGNDRLVALYTVTTGSEHDPLPLGDWKVTAISRNPKFHYNPALFWDASPGDKAAMLPPGPNGPVGVVWIDLSKPHYGIHGTPNPETIGRTESHGCVRLTNWDAARLALMVKAGVKVVFEA